ncbi:Hypothetical predicted protein, partial [Marmota monax]
DAPLSRDRSLGSEGGDRRRLRSKAAALGLGTDLPAFNIPYSAPYMENHRCFAPGAHLSACKVQATD